MLIHVGLDTVKLGGRHFTACVKKGDKVRRGQTLLKFDLQAIVGEGYDVTTPLVIVNGEDRGAELLGKGAVSFGEPVLRIVSSEQAAAEAMKEEAGS